MEAMIEVGPDRIWVDDNEADAPAMLLAHPGIHDSTVWDPLLGLLGGFRVVRYDARGFGRSPRASEQFRFVDDLAAVLDHLGLERVHLVGNSLGGRSCLSMALKAPERVRSLTLLAPGIVGYPWPDDDPAIEKEYAAAKRDGDRAEMIDLYRRIWCAAGADEGVLARLGASYDTEVAQGPYELDDPEQWSRVASITVPVAVVVGVIDIPSMVTGSTDLAAEIPGAELVRLEGVDHLPSLRAPDAVAEVVRRTVARAG